MSQKIIIDADPGIGDALAVLIAMVDPSLEVVGLTATAGTVSGIQATRNLQFLTELADPVKHPRVGECSRAGSVVGVSTDFGRTHHSFCGRHGLGDLDVVVPDLHNRRESAKLIIDLVQEYPHQIRILTLGPLTNLAAALELDPMLDTQLDSVVCLGGTDRCGGDVAAMSEFNIWCDPEAAASVLAAPVTKTLVPLDISSSCVLTFEDVDILTELMSSARHGETLSSMLHFSLRANHQLALEGIPLHSVVALAVAARAESFSLEAVKAGIETRGELTRGMTVIDRRRDSSGQTNLDIVSAIDEHGIVDYFSRSLRRVAG